MPKNSSATSLPTAELHALFGSRFQENVKLAYYVTARVGGLAPGLLTVYSKDEIEHAVQHLERLNVPFFFLGNGSNVLISDAGFQGVVIINKARLVKIDVHTDPPTVWAESGANLSSIARQTALRGLSGLEWAATIPGTVGGAIYGNAGAHGGDMCSSLVLAEILHPDRGRETCSCEQLGLGYRTSFMKRSRERVVILAAQMRLSVSTPAEVQARIDANIAQRQKTQPTGASLGSMFKNPEGDSAGRLIEAAGLKGTRIGNVEISQKHANFFINLGDASANDVYQLIRLAQKKVWEKFGIELQLEIELLGDWPPEN